MEAFDTFRLYEQVADLVFVRVNNREEADFKIITYNGTPGPRASVLGRMKPPNEANEGQAEFIQVILVGPRSASSKAASTSPRFCTNLAMASAWRIRTTLAAAPA